MIRTPVEGDSQVRTVGRTSQGVTIFRTAEGERVVSVERLAEVAGDGDGDDDMDGPDEGGEVEGGDA